MISVAYVSAIIMLRLRIEMCYTILSVQLIARKHYFSTSRNYFEQKLQQMNNIDR